MIFLGEFDINLVTLAVSRFLVSITPAEKGLDFGLRRISVFSFAFCFAYWLTYKHILLLRIQLHDFTAFLYACSMCIEI